MNFNNDGTMSASKNFESIIFALIFSCWNQLVWLVKLS